MDNGAQLVCACGGRGGGGGKVCVWGGGYDVRWLMYEYQVILIQVLTFLYIVIK